MVLTSGIHQSNIKNYEMLVVFSVLLIFSTTGFAQRTTTDDGPFKPFGGKKETIYLKNFPAETREYDANNILRKVIYKKEDLKKRITEEREEVLDTKNNIIAGYMLTRAFKDDADLTGTISQKKYNLQKKIYEPVVISAPPPALKLDPFYKRYIDAGGIPIVASEKTPIAALLVASDIVNFMLSKRPEIRKELIKRKSRVCIMAATEMETDLPERRSWKKPVKSDPRLTPYERENYDKPGGIGSQTDQQYWNARARGMGGTIVSCAEENLLGYPSTRYYGENILVHEFSHNMMDGLRTVNPNLYTEIGKAYAAAKSKDLFKNQYAMNTVAEYWAEGSQWWFWSNFPFYDGDRKISSPTDLKAYDPTLYQLFEKVYPEGRIAGDVYWGIN